MWVCEWTQEWQAVSRLRIRRSARRIFPPELVLANVVFLSFPTSRSSNTGRGPAPGVGRTQGSLPRGAGLFYIRPVTLSTPKPATGQGHAAPLFGQVGVGRCDALEKVRRTWRTCLPCASAPQRLPRSISGRIQRPWDEHTRNPMLLFELSGSFLFRSRARALSRSLFHDPPRKVLGLSPQNHAGRTAGEISPAPPVYGGAVSAWDLSFLLSSRPRDCRSRSLWRPHTGTAWA